ncbi:hypothetical protein BYT27DRAFT_7249673 [Phlegmacium glaucopus]|nr:hypothetical protein BYT27DRAFT_7249673 [Phlegmacium glaucopus]
MNALQASKLCDVTGVVSIACGRHGCYAPQALVDLFKGEQQKNVDFALLSALKSTRVEPEQGVLLIYDIACQYFVHLHDRIGSRLPFGLDIDAAIGLFHVHAHKDQCFFQYASSFIPGAAIIAGEILESLWSSLNTISPTARTATLEHRAEMLDDHATDSNHNKTLGIISSLCRSHSTAVDMLDHAKTYYQGLMDQGASQHMDVYAAKLDNTLLDTRHSATGMLKSALASWMELSLAVEEKQLEIQATVQQLGRNPTSTDRQTIETERDRLTALLFELKTAMGLAGIPESGGAALVENETLETWDEVAPHLAPSNPPPLIDRPYPDRRPGNPAAIECFQYSHVIRVSPRKGVNTHSRAAVKKLNLKILVHCRMYTQCRACLLRLGADPAVLSCFRILTPDDVKTSTAIMNPNKPGSTQLTLSWIWQTAGGHRWGLATGNHLSAGAGATSATHIIEFRRVHWLRARAQ